MKKILLLAALVAVAFMPVTAQADTIDYLGQFIAGAGSGGEFTFKAVSGPALDTSAYSTLTKDYNQTGSFQTFCVERNESISTSFNPMNYSLDRAAVKGGSGGPSPDPISVGTGFLYSQFAAGTLAGYNYSGPGRQTSQVLLQEAIWWLENELASAPAGNPFVGAVLAKFGTLDAARADGGWTYGVYALNVWNSNSARIDRQSQLFYVPDSGATLALLGAALMGLGALRRRLS